jgi:PAS domain S-box-containing protein
MGLRFHALALCFAGVRSFMGRYHCPEIMPSDNEIPHSYSGRAGPLASSMRFEELADRVPVGIFETDLDGTTTYVNRYCCKLAGLTLEEAMGHGWVTHLHPDDRDRLAEAWAQAVRSRSPFVEIYRFLTPDGQCTWVSTKAELIRDGSGTPTGYLGKMSDITERKLAEIALGEANRRLQTILDASPVAILSMDPQGRILGWNRGAECMFGWSEVEIKGQICPTVPEHGVADFLNMIRTVMDGQPFRGQVRDRRKRDGEVVRAGISAAPLRDANGVVIGIVAILDDVTARERATERLRALLEERESLAQDLHDNCIQAIYSIGLNLEECRELVREDPTMATRKIADAEADLNLVIQDLRIQVLGDKREIADGHGLQAALENSIRMMNGRAPAFSLEFDSAAASSLAPEQAAHLLQIGREAISNVARHADARRCRVSLQAKGETVCFEVNDDGAGFDPGAREKHGLGLHNIEARVRKLRGRMELVSRPGRGSRVVIEIPARRPA